MRLTALLAFALAAAPAAAQPARPADHSTWITLGTTAGPIPNPTRSQPANLLRSGGQNILIDAGDGAAEQLGKAGVRLDTIRTIFISHLHFDHMGGLFAILGMRYQTQVASPLTIYGPPGTRRMVEGLLAAAQPMSEVGSGFVGAPRRPVEAGIIVEEIADGARVTLGDIRVTAARNSHYSYPENSPEAQRFQSLSLRFDLPDRSIVYTGDTGPSAAVERLAQGADLLISEVIDPDGAMADLLRQRPDLPIFARAFIMQHFREQHLTGTAAGQIARTAHVRRLLLTHIAVPPEGIAATRAAAAAAYGGPVEVATDLGHY